MLKGLLQRGVPKLEADGTLAFNSNLGQTECSLDLSQDANADAILVYHALNI
jgi:hypothetical protein